MISFCMLWTSFKDFRVLIVGFEFFQIVGGVIMSFFGLVRIINSFMTRNQLYRNQFIEFLYDWDLRHERVNLIKEEYFSSVNII